MADHVATLSAAASRSPREREEAVQSSLRETQAVIQEARNTASQLEKDVGHSLRVTASHSNVPSLGVAWLPVINRDPPRCAGCNMLVMWRSHSKGGEGRTEWVRRFW